MTNQEIEDLAFSLGLWDVFDGQDCSYLKAIKDFAAIVVTQITAHEREACAKVCEEGDWTVAAAMVRARKNT